MGFGEIQAVLANNQRLKDSEISTYIGAVNIGSAFGELCIR
jgi:hypothetical protein